MKETKNVAVYGSKKGKSDVYHLELEKGIGSLEEAAEKGIDTFVLTEQLITRQDIFNQLMDYCRQHQACIVDEWGRNVSQICQKALDTRFCDKATLLDAIKVHDYISFDIFDTLLMRKVLLPEDVFELTARRLAKQGTVIKDFKQKRLKAQEELGLTNPDIYDIYERFQKKYKITKEVAEFCIELELQIESEVLVAREEMVAIYRECQKLGKKVYLVTDMYIPAEKLKPILDKNGITDYDGLYVSCDKKQLKLQGLLEQYRDEQKAKNCLHIGDHLIHDAICAGLAGMDYCLISSAIKMAQKTDFKESIMCAVTLEEHVMLGLVFARIMNSPFQGVTEDGRIKIVSDYDYAYGFCAAIVSQYILWMYDKVKKEGYDDILFASRDGFLIQKMYGFLRGQRNDESMPKGIYFYTSRKASVMTCINNEAYINMIIDISDGMPPGKMMKERFGLAPKDIHKYEKEKYDIVHPYVWEHVAAIFKRADEARLNYFKYMGNINLGIGKRYAFMDFVSSATSQKSLAKIAPFELQGLYVGWNGTDDKNEVGVTPMFEGNGTYFMKYYKVMETFMTSDEPSLSHFDSNGKPVFDKQDRSESELTYVSNMQKACMDFFMDFIDMADISEDGISNDFTDSVFAASDRAEMLDKESVLNHLTLMDDWRKKRMKKAQMIQK